MPTSIRVVREPITLDDLRVVARDQFGEMVKAVVDVALNVRPAWGNRSRSVEDPVLQARVRGVVDRLVRE